MTVSVGSITPAPSPASRHSSTVIAGGSCLSNFIYNIPRAAVMITLPGFTILLTGLILLAVTDRRLGWMEGDALVCFIFLILGGAWTLGAIIFWIINYCKVRKKIPTNNSRSNLDIIASDEVSNNLELLTISSSKVLATQKGFNMENGKTSERLGVGKKEENEIKNKIHVSEVVNSETGCNYTIDENNKSDAEANEQRHSREDINTDVQNHSSDDANANITTESSGFYSIEDLNLDQPLDRPMDILSNQDLTNYSTGVSSNEKRPKDFV